MFSILVSELTAQLIAKAEYWKIYEANANGMPYWADIRRAERLRIAKLDSSEICLLCHVRDAGYYGNNLCHPVTFTPDGTEVRLECPRMPDEVEIEEWQGQNAPPQFAMYQRREKGVMWWILERKGKQVTPSVHGPTNQHYPRRTCDGVWVWSTRR